MRYAFRFALKKMYDWTNDHGDERLREKDKKEPVSIEMFRPFAQNRSFLGHRSTFIPNSNGE